MQYFTRELANNAQTILHGAVSGLCMGVTGLVLTMSMTKQPISKSQTGMFFINRNEDIAEPLGMLAEMLVINGRTTDQAVMDLLILKLNTLAGYDELVESPSAYPLFLNYSVNELIHSITQLMNVFIQQPFAIPSLGLDICTQVERIMEVVDNIKTNVLHETNLRVMNSIEFS